MFELNENIKKWHSELIANQSMNETNADELISHLKDNVEELNIKGLSEEESYWIARHRLGDTQALRIEFTKINQALLWRNRILWLLFGYFLFTTIGRLVSLATIPIHLLDVQWLLVNYPLYSPKFTVPIPLFLFILLIFGGIFYLVTGQKNIFNKNKMILFNFISRFKMGYKFILAFLGFYLITSFISFFSTLLIARMYGPSTIGRISASGAVFSGLWNVFLVIFLVILSILILKRKKEHINT